MSIPAALTEYFSTSKTPVLFAGAGVPMRVGLPSWPDLLKQLADHIRTDDPLTAAHIDQSTARGHLSHAALLYMSCPNTTPVKRQQGLQRLLTATSVDGLGDLVQLPFSAIATTNFDRTLLDAFAQFRGTSAVDHFLGAPDFVHISIEQKFYVARLHGRIDGSGQIIFTSADYSHLESNEGYLDIVRHLLTHTQLLFVGFSFLDPAIASILNAVKKLYGGRAEGEHLALIPADSADSFVRSLETFNIRRVIYDPAEKHRELWDGIASHLASRSALPIPPSSGPGAASIALENTRRFLSSTYARLCLSDGIDSLRRATIEGIVLGLIAESTTAGLAESVLRERLRTLVGLKKKEVKDVVAFATQNLRRAKLVRQTAAPDRGLVFFSEVATISNPLAAALATLEQSVVSRLSVMRGIDAPSTMRGCIRQTLEDFVYERGWDLGVSFLSRLTPPNLDVEAYVRKNGTALSLGTLQDVSAALKNLLSLPTPNEAELLTVLGRSSFSLALVYSAPRSTLVHASILPKRIYLDASVLLPAIVEGHRFQQLYKSTIASLQKAAKQSGAKIEILCYHGYLNEVVSHRRRAIQEFEIEGANFAEFAKRGAVLYGSENLNVFVGAYAQLLMKDSKLTFDSFLRRVAPYETETDLERFLRNFSIRVVRRQSIEGSKLAKISFALQKAYATDLLHRKSAMLIEHDAIQLSALEKDSSQGITSLWVSADQRLRAKLAASDFHRLNDHITSHVGLAQLVDLLTQVRVDPLAYSGLLWGVRPSEEAERVKDYLIRRGLEHYSEAYAMEMPSLVNQIVDRYEAAAYTEKISLDANEDEDVARAVRLVGGFENEFFSTMDANIKKQKERK